jgi:hypothetical protein
MTASAVTQEIPSSVMLSSKQSKMEIILLNTWLTTTQLELARTVHMDQALTTELAHLVQITVCLVSEVFAPSADTDSDLIVMVDVNSTVNSIIQDALLATSVMNVQRAL